MGGLFDVLDDLIVDHWVKLLVGIVLFVVGRWWGRVRSRREWQSKEFKNRVTISLNSIVDNKLLIRTVLEKEAGEIFINDEAVNTVLEAATRTDELDPVIHLPPEDRWHLLNAVLNEIAENFKTGLFARDMGLPVQVRRYVFCLTREVAGDLKARKIRVMLIQPEMISSDDHDLSRIETELPHHATRLKTLEAMRRAWRVDQEDFMSLEIIVPQ